MKNKRYKRLAKIMYGNCINNPDCTECKFYYEECANKLNQSEIPMVKGLRKLELRLKESN